MEQPPAGSGAPAPDDDIVPITGTWTRMYAAVIVVALLSIGSVALFQGWPF